MPYFCCSLNYNMYGDYVMLCDNIQTLLIFRAIVDLLMSSRNSLFSSMYISVFANMHHISTTEL